MAHVDRVPGAVPRARLAALAGRTLGAMPPPALVLFGIVSLQVGAAVAKQLFSLAGAAGTVTLRLVGAAVVLVLVWRPSLRLDRRTLLVVLGFGAVLGCMNLAFYQALARIPLGAAVTIEFLGPLAVAVAGSRRWLDGLWALLAGGGVVLLTRSDGGLAWSGVLFALVAAVCWACYIMLGAALGSRTDDGKGLALSAVLAGLLVLPFGIADAGTTLLQPAVLIAGLGVALLSSVIPYSLELEALRRIPPRVFGVLMSLEPAVAAVAGLLVLGESLRPVQWVAVCCVVIASAGATRAARPDV
ncbi:EamA family transporter [Solihabitans fulvus]|uniref:EamA family transporter n=1 Tax=Solihabitans fulvus TaxID=1892852 RepID=A0A5B2XDM7_9PSEU|nr:EamA family transporter [Solihabitans fulvus]KAA2261205.1 EamA family transporter [Solihabitans fulvus]